MREGIHPKYYQAKVVCNCGNEFVTGSTKEDIHVEICSKCHSFYTGQQKAAKARGRIDKFNRKYGMYHRECCDVVPSPNFGYTRCEITHISQQECEAFLKGGAL